MKSPGYFAASFGFALLAILSAMIGGAQMLSEHPNEQGHMASGGNPIVAMLCLLLALGSFVAMIAAFIRAIQSLFEKPTLEVAHVAPPVNEFRVEPLDTSIPFSDIPWLQTSQGARVKAAQAAGKLIRMVEFTHGFKEPQWCLRGHMGYVVHGTLHLDVNGTEVVYRTGDAIALPAGEISRHRHMWAESPTLLFLVEDLPT